MYNIPHVGIPEKATPVAQSLRLTGETGKIGVGEYAVDFSVGTPLNQEEIMERTETSIKNVVSSKFQSCGDFRVFGALEGKSPQGFSSA